VSAYSPATDHQDHVPWITKKHSNADEMPTSTPGRLVRNDMAYVLE